MEKNISPAKSIYSQPVHPRQILIWLAHLLMILSLQLRPLMHLRQETQYLWSFLRRVPHQECFPEQIRQQGRLLMRPLNWVYL